MTEQQEVQVPDQLVELAQEQRPAVWARGLIEHFMPRVLDALNYTEISQPRQGQLTPESFTAAVDLEMSTNDRLARAAMASPQSFMKSLMLAAQCKLLPGGSYDLFYLIPRWNGKLKVEEVTPLIGYKGLCELAQRHPRVHKIDAILVYEGETFEYDAGAGKLTHKVNLLGDRSPEKCVGGYARVVITEPASTHPVLDDPVVHVMNRDEIDKIMKRSDAWKRAEQKGWNNSPWHTDWKPMARKTLIRAVMNGGAVPKDMGLGGAIAADDAAQITPRDEEPTLPKVTSQENIRQKLGIDEAPEVGEAFDLAEEAVAAIQDAPDKAALEALKHRWQHFDGIDATTIAEAYEARLEALGEA